MSKIETKINDNQENTMKKADANDCTEAMIPSVAIEQFRRDGYLILERCIPPADLALLQRSCDELLAAGMAEVDKVSGSRPHKFLFGAAEKKPELDQVNFGPLMAELCRQTLGPDVWHVNDQYSYKDARSGGSFGWHQDGAYIGAPHKPYLTVWIALCDMSEQNGTISVIPRTRAKLQGTIAGAKELVNGYEKYIGDDRGEIVNVPAGSIATFHSDIFHVSGHNVSDRPRTAYITKYGVEPVLGKLGQGLALTGRPFLQDGRCLGADQP